MYPDVSSFFYLVLYLWEVPCVVAYFEFHSFSLLYSIVFLYRNRPIEFILLLMST